MVSHSGWCPWEAAGRQPVTLETADGVPGVCVVLHGFLVAWEAANAARADCGAARTSYSSTVLLIEALEIELHSCCKLSAASQLSALAHETVAARLWALVLVVWVSGRLGVWRCARIGALAAWCDQSTLHQACHKHH